ncbi:hypothetical protein [Aeoliella mucimassa]|uniref:Uncharacterized protein n=1 Tax=Aeoliella mucimassa TaxID=2527972 RepID=A0A518AV52_9BACT|nr:hypothetical protein [Aeoliella mucimassa]QDU58590.1 hypothetical protein Pan181_48290 [Aeoliella mucimassa]
MNPLERAKENYVAAERDRIRDVSMARLRELIDLLMQLPEEDRYVWAREFARELLEGDEGTPVRSPMFREVIFPALHAGLRDRLPGCARWMAGFYPQLYKSPDCLSKLPAGQRTYRDLLRLAIDQDPIDALARGKLIDSIAGALDFAIHEVPDGVLAWWTSNSVSLEECHILQAELAEFEALAKQHGNEQEHAELIEECRYHFTAYADYLERRPEFTRYAEYLAADGRPEGF